MRRRFATILATVGVAYLVIQVAGAVALLTVVPWLWGIVYLYRHRVEQVQRGAADAMEAAVG